jgi:hypothetical protein
MTGPEDSHSSTRPISVAELLAKNGTIGAPPVGGRRRRRRGDSDAVTVAELTGEIPIVRDHDHADADEDDDGASAAETTRTLPVVTDEPVKEPTAPPTNGAADPTAQDVDDHAEAVADYAAHVEDRHADVDLDFFAPPRRSSFAPRRFKTPGDAERMSPDPVEDEDALDSALAETDPADVDRLDAEEAHEAVGDVGARDELPSYLRSSSSGLFGGPSAIDDVPRRAPKPSPDDIDLGDHDHDYGYESQAAMSSFARGAWVVGQCVLAVAFGAGLFIAFDQLWKWNNIVALVLSVLVILGLVVGVRVVRKTEDIGSTLIAVAVGALVTLGPLALLQSG